MKPIRLLLLGSALAALPAHADFKSDLAAIRQVAGQGKGNAAAGSAWQSLAKGSVATLVPLLALILARRKLL